LEKEAKGDAGIVQDAFFKRRAKYVCRKALAFFRRAAVRKDLRAVQAALQLFPASLPSGISAIFT
jgi:hypothetical protein